MTDENKSKKIEIGSNLAHTIGFCVMLISISGFLSVVAWQYLQPSPQHFAASVTLHCGGINSGFHTSSGLAGFNLTKNVTQSQDLSMLRIINSSVLLNNPNLQNCTVQGSVNATANVALSSIIGGFMNQMFQQNIKTMK